MRKRIAGCFVVAFASVFGAAACAEGGQQDQQRIEQLEEDVADLQGEVEEIELLLGMELQEEPKQEQTQQEQTQEKTQ